MKLHRNKSTLLFYTCATGRYLPFLPIFVYFAGRSNPGASFEFLVDDDAQCEADFKETFAFLRTTFRLPLQLQSAGPLKDKLPMHNTLRFVVPPLAKAEFVYIGDIDIAIVENVAKVHSPVFKAGLPYSNIIRPVSQHPTTKHRRMSGLHFSRYEALYPVPAHEDIISQYIVDEEVLYQLLKRKGALAAQPQIDACRVGRPQHGIHMSLNRIPFADGVMKLSWGITWNHAVHTMKLMSDATFRTFLETLPRPSRLLLANLYYLCKSIVSEGPEMLQDFSAGKEFSAPADSSPQTPQHLFTHIYARNAWQGSESRSGPSSSLARTATLRIALPRVVRDYDFKSILDAPCGDFHWMQHVLKEVKVNYVGGDIVEDLVRRNTTDNAIPNTSFRLLDLTKDELPESDLFFCRDCLFHFSYRDIALVFQSFLRSKCRYILTTSHINKTGFENTDIKTGQWRWFDLLKAPFNLASNFKETLLDGGGDRYMYLWDKKDIRPSMGKFIAATLPQQKAMSAAK